MQHRNNLVGIVVVLSSLSFLGWVAVRSVAAVRFEQDIGGHLKRAADANNLTLAASELDDALYNMDAWHLCTAPGYTSLLWRTPDEDVGFWCANIASTLDDATVASLDGVDYMTESNMLIKVRETLLDHGESGDQVTAPKGISVYPNNSAFAWWGFLSFVGVVAASARVRK